jgi:hypothetical protein
MRTNYTVPILRNPRHEKFAQELSKGESAHEAYINAGFRPSRQNASRLRTNEDINARVLELQMAGAKSAEITIGSLLDELEHARQRADSLGQLSASVRAISEKARLAGLVVEKQEVKLVSDEYEPRSAAEVLANVVEKVGEKAARALADAFEIEFPEEILLSAKATNGSSSAQRQQSIDWRPPRADRKREL